VKEFKALPLDPKIYKASKDPRELILERTHAKVRLQASQQLVTCVPVL
jgi:hypothetical protein